MSQTLFAILFFSSLFILAIVIYLLGNKCPNCNRKWEKEQRRIYECCDGDDENENGDAEVFDIEHCSACGYLYSKTYAGYSPKGSNL